MAILKFNKAELVNLGYSLRREVFGANGRGAYFNTSIIGCNTRKYHGLLVVPVENFGGAKFVLLSSLDESIVLGGRQFNLGIHCYGDVYEPKGHKYIVDFDADNLPTITYKVGPVVLKKSVVMSKSDNRVFIKYFLEKAPGKVSLQFKPFLAFRGIHSLTKENDRADTGFAPISNGVAFHMYDGFPSVNIQTSFVSEYRHQPYWYKGVTYSDEYRRGYDCMEDLLVPGTLAVNMRQGDEMVISVSTAEENPRTIRSSFARLAAGSTNVCSHKDILVKNSEYLKIVKGGRKMICAGYSWLSDGLLRETLLSLPGLTLYAGAPAKEFEEILDNLIEVEGDRLFHRTTQIEAPLLLADVLQQYMAFGASAARVRSKYGATLRQIIESYACREEVRLCPNGLLWAKKDNTALSWMNTYHNGNPVNERAGFQVETNALWYNALCFTIENCSGQDKAFVEKWAPVRDAVKANFEPTFKFTRRGHHSLADFVDDGGQHCECRPNMLWAAYIPYPLVDEEVQGDIITCINNELITRRGIRTLSPRSADYKGMYDGSQWDRDQAYHNGCTHTLLLGPYVDVCFRMVGDHFCGKAKWLTEGFFEDVNVHGVGSFSEIYDADPPHEPHGAIVSATATAALLRCVYLMEKYSAKKEEK